MKTLIELNELELELVEYLKKQIPSTTLIGVIRYMLKHVSNDILFCPNCNSKNCIFRHIDNNLCVKCFECKNVQKLL